MQDTRG